MNPRSAMKKKATAIKAVAFFFYSELTSMPILECGMRIEKTEGSSS
jgi:hypothetical protein